MAATRTEENEKEVKDFVEYGRQIVAWFYDSDSSLVKRGLDPDHLRSTFSDKYIYSSEYYPLEIDSPIYEKLKEWYLQSLGAQGVALRKVVSSRVEQEMKRSILPPFTREDIERHLSEETEKEIQDIEFDPERDDILVYRLSITCEEDEDDLWDYYGIRFEREPDESCWYNFDAKFLVVVRCAGHLFFFRHDFDHEIQCMVKEYFCFPKRKSSEYKETEDKFLRKYFDPARGKVTSTTLARIITQDNFGAIMHDLRSFTDTENAYFASRCDWEDEEI